MIKLIFLCLLAPMVTFAGIKLPPLHHVVDVLVPDIISIPDSFPLNEKQKIDCKTCHGIKNIEDKPFEEVDRDAKNFFREGPYTTLTDFCYQCHDKKEYKQDNIHQLIDDNGELKKDKCTFCHVETPKPKEDYQREDFEFRVAPQKLCLGCHLKTPHINANTHLLEVNDEMLKRIRKYEKDKQVSIPLNGKLITCISCHAVHQKGVLNDKIPAGKQVQDRHLEEGIGYKKHAWNGVVKKDKEKRLKKLSQDSDKEIDVTYQRLTHEVLIRLPAKDGTLCLACHKFDL